MESTKFIAVKARLNFRKAEIFMEAIPLIWKSMLDKLIITVTNK